MTSPGVSTKVTFELYQTCTKCNKKRKETNITYNDIQHMFIETLLTKKLIFKQQTITAYLRKDEPQWTLTFVRRVVKLFFHRKNSNEWDFVTFSLGRWKGEEDAARWLPRVYLRINNSTQPLKPNLLETLRNTYNASIDDHELQEVLNEVEEHFGEINQQEKNKKPLGFYQWNANKSGIVSVANGFYSGDR